MDFVRLLLESGANPNAEDDECSTLCTAASLLQDGNDKSETTKYINILKMLLAFGAQPHRTDGDKDKIPFSYVLEFGTMEAVQLFSEYGVTFENCGVSDPLHHAAQNSTKDILEYLLQNYNYNVDKIPYSEDSLFYSTCITFATSCVEGCNLRDWDGVDLLLSAGAQLKPSASGDKWRDLMNHATKPTFQKTLCSLVGEVVLIKNQDPDRENILIEKLSNLFPELETRCLAELEELKNLTFYGSVTLYDLLRGKDVTRYIDNVQVAELFESRKIVERFPIYGNRIENTYSFAKTRRALVDEATKIVSNILQFRFSHYHDILHTIMSHFRFKDLRALHKKYA
ncbi:hypothetical protein QAD02_018769 [Eretmocerus hayati]|uniref:Uncharacterized protein n=1 Tax=Eretmocerus hayati TaxID=131215 RepID=A0ACC2PKN9_9HYME|nr:hypothetical protein QAD02_018769 [Eretmocerus hayati]